MQRPHRHRGLAVLADAPGVAPTLWTQLTRQKGHVRCSSNREQLTLPGLATPNSCVWGTMWFASAEDSCACLTT